MKTILFAILFLVACSGDSISESTPDAGSAKVDASTKQFTYGVRNVCIIRAYQDPPPGPLSTDTVCAPSGNSDLAMDRAGDANPDHEVLSCAETQYTCPL